MRALRQRYSRCRPGRAPLPSVMSPTNQAYHAEHCLLDGGMSNAEHKDAVNGTGNWKGRKYGGYENENPLKITDAWRDKVKAYYPSHSGM